MSSLVDVMAREVGTVGGVAMEVFLGFGQVSLRVGWCAQDAAAGCVVCGFISDCDFFSLW